jgi:Peptidase family M1 domain
MGKRLFVSLLLLIAISTNASAQPSRWQQRVNYKIDVNMNVETNRFTGKQVIEYSNNSPDTLKLVFFHLFWNAFQPKSMMDVRSREQGKRVINGRNDWDFKITDKIIKLQPEEIGYQKVLSLKLNGVLQKTEEFETILKVVPVKPILPKSKVVFEMDFEAQVPVQIRRSGRDNAEGVRYSMAQWYPKLCEYDYEGWHPIPYISREFYGVWGDYEVNITIDKNYIIGATGYLQNPGEIGYGYETTGSKVTKPQGKTLKWRFLAPHVHDFVWAADPEFKHVTKTIRNGLVLHAFYKIEPDRIKKQYEDLSDRDKRALRNNPENYVRYYQYEWENVLDWAAVAFPFIEKTFGRYPYKQFSFIQGGDGGMEYPMATLLKGAGEGVIYHEMLHSWFQGVLGNNESLHAWMDEGFTQYAENRLMSFLEGDTASFPQIDSYSSYFDLVKSDYDEPLTTPADQFNTNFAYRINSYDKGAVFLEQLGYIVGSKKRDEILREYYKRWMFKHPNPTDFIRVAEEISGIQLGWYKNYFVSTTKTIDYGIDSLWEENGKTKIRLKNAGPMPMPLDIVLTFKDGSSQISYIPQYLMFGQKPNEVPSISRTVHDAWRWTHPFYEFEVNRRLLDLKTIEIDPSRRMADINRKNNKLELNW